jgi:hypothetical protein
MHLLSAILEQIKQFSKLIKYIQLQYIPKMQTNESEYVLFFCKILEVYTVGIVLTEVDLGLHINSGLAYTASIFVALNLHLSANKFFRSLALFPSHRKKYFC